MGPRGLCCVPGVLLLLNLPSTMAQVPSANSAAPAPRFSITARAVAVDVVVTRAVDPVPGLNQRDFEVLEDGNKAAWLATGIYDQHAERTGTLEVPLNKGAKAAEPQESASTGARSTELPTPSLDTFANAVPLPVHGPGANLPDPGLVHRPPPKPPSAISPEGRISFDVMVSDAAGKAVAGLQPWDFKLLDNGPPGKGHIVPVLRRRSRSA